MNDANLLRPKVSVVIPTFNRSELLRRAVASVLAQERVSCEVIIVDDGSTPPVALDAFQSEVTVIRNEGEGGVAAARNLGARYARAEWLAFLDDDDWWACDHLQRLVEAALEARADFAYAATWDVDIATRTAVFRPAPSPTDLSTQLLQSNAIGTPSCVMLRRSLHMAIGGFDTTLAPMADWDLWLRIVEIGTAAMSPAATVAYALHDANMSLDLSRLVSEFHRLSERYAATCQRADVKFGFPGFPHWIARLYRRQGRRREAAAWYLRSARSRGHRRDLLRAAGVLLGERAMRAAATVLGEANDAHPARRAPQTPPSAPFNWISTCRTSFQPRPSAAGERS